ncbi:MAG: NUDIX hydrolase [Verrucomicrobia bacterium]|nr:NUDIX hydrolase [Verrucomicrobiota bacterium]
MFKKLTFLQLCIAPLLIGGEIVPIVAPSPPTAQKLETYFQFMKDHPKAFGPDGKWRDGEIEIVSSPEMIKKIQNQTRLRLISNGYSEEHARAFSSVGVVAEDNYLLWLRDAVIFPSGVYGTYDRLLWKSGMDGISGVAILPILSSKKIVVNINYRHATRCWEMEIPRGCKKEGESWEKAATRELLEETGYQITKCIPLGTMAPDSGIFSSLVPVLYGEVNVAGESANDYSEAIHENPAFSKEELKQAFGRGYIQLPIKGKLVQVQCRDPFLSYALLQAEVKGLL